MKHGIINLYNHMDFFRYLDVLPSAFLMKHGIINLYNHMDFFRYLDVLPSSMMFHFN